MRIAINTRFLLSNKMEGFGWYTYEIVTRLVEKHPEHEFIFFFDRKYNPKFVFGKNVTPVILRPQARHPFLFYFWFEIAVSKALKKYKADVFFSPDGYLSLKSMVKQIAVIHDINFEHNPEDLPFLMRKYYQYFFPRFAKKASRIITVSEYSKKDICGTYGVDSDKVSAIWNGASSAFKPLTDGEKTEVRRKETDTCPYFLFVGALHPRKNVKRLIEAFVLLKRQKKSDHKLLIVGTELWSNAAGALNIPEDLKDEIRFAGHLQLDELARIMGAAEALVFVPYFEGFGIPLVEAMRCGTPIISGNRTSLPEVGGEAAIYCDPFKIEEIKTCMLQIVENPVLQEELRKKGLERSKLFSWDLSAEKVWAVIESLSLNPKT